MVRTTIVKDNGRNIIVKAGTFNMTKNGIAKSLSILGFSGSAKQVRKAGTAKRVEKEVLFQLRNELTRGRGGKFLFDPVTRKRTANPMRTRWLQIARKLVVAIKILKAVEKLGKK